MSATQQKFDKKPTIQDKYGTWTVGTDGRHFFNYVDAINGKVKIDLGLLNKTTDALNNKFPEADNPDEQESQNAYFYDEETFSISQFKGLTLIYKGAAKYPSKTLATLPGSKPKTEGQAGGGTQTTFTSGKGNNWKGKSGGYNNNWNKGGSNFVGLQDFKPVTMEEAIELCTAEKGYVFPPQDKYPPIYEDNVQKIIIGKPAMR